VSAARLIRARGIVKGRASGPALVAREPISFLGDIDIRSGKIVGSLPSVRGKCVARKVLVFPASIGSAGAWRFLYQLYRHGTHPVALVCRELPDPSVVQGAILAGIPIVCEPEADVLALIADGDRVEVDGSGRIVVRGPALGRHQPSSAATRSRRGGRPRQAME
jgi:predicted aconitase with swiveling domain